MVHALKLTRGIIKPGGWLINVHDLPVPHLIEVHTLEASYKAGWLLNKEDIESTRSSLYALSQVVLDGYFILEDERSFIYNISADSVTELQEWLAEWWSSATLPVPIIQRLEELTRETGQFSKIILPLQTRMTLLKAA